MEFSYFQEHESEQFTFFRIPKVRLYVWHGCMVTISIGLSVQHVRGIPLPFTAISGGRKNLWIWTRVWWQVNAPQAGRCRKKEKGLKWMSHANGRKAISRFSSRWRQTACLYTVLSARQTGGRGQPIPFRSSLV